MIDGTVLTMRLFEIAKQTVSLSQAKFGKIPKPTTQVKIRDTDWYKVEMYHNDINHVVSSVVLKPSHCYALLNA